MRKLLPLVLLVGLASCQRSKTDPLRLGFFPNLTHAQALVGNAEGTFQQALGKRPLELRPFNAGPAAMEESVWRAPLGTPVVPEEYRM